jgi:hypothetical protein
MTARPTASPPRLAGYLPAWVGHFYPLYRLRGDFAMLAEVLTGRLRW